MEGRDGMACSRTDHEPVQGGYKDQRAEGRDG